ncbi:MULTISPECIES: TlpA disulfide reductase family protein [Robertmurraya]|uniref:TlpA disulfide reductase family protein n=1 Tax=Robertmurraya beringensis TaxID=641660 RepID=A0ABV6KPS6_9BACI
MPGWQDFHEKHKNQDFEILSVSVDVQGAEVVKPYAQNKSYTTVIDLENEMANYFGFKVVPNGIFIDKNGIIRLIKQRFYVTDPEHLNAIEKLINGNEETVVLDDENLVPVNDVGHLEKQLSETKFKLALQYANNGKKEEALKELDEALLLDTDNFLIRKQRWYIRYPEKFSPTIDMEWQQEQLAKEKAQEATLYDSNSCAPEGCHLPTK